MKVVDDLVEIKETDMQAFFGLNQLEKLKIQKLKYHFNNLQMMRGGSVFPLVNIKEVYLHDADAIEA